MRSFNTQKRILFLGGAYSQIPILKEAKDRGYYLITCDYLPGNPGHNLADEYHNVSTTDREGILTLAQIIKPDYIVAYASDPAALTAAYVSEKLDLPGNTYESVCILSEKDKFRHYLKKNRYNAPEFVLLTERHNASEKLMKLNLPFIVKPTDSSGSKGVCKVSATDEIDFAVKNAFEYSRNNRIIAEEYIDNKVGDIHGDGFVVDGRLIFLSLGDHVYNQFTNPFNPIGTLWPSSLPEKLIRTTEQLVSDIVKGCGFKNGPVNVEARINSEGRCFIMEIGPRSGGHFVPQAIKYSTGFDEVGAMLDLIEGSQLSVPDKRRECSAYYAIHSDYDGELKHLSLKEDLMPFVKEFHQYHLPGSRIRAFEGANDAIGILLMTFSDRPEMESIIERIHSLVALHVDTTETGSFVKDPPKYR